MARLFSPPRDGLPSLDDLCHMLIKMRYMISSRLYSRSKHPQSVSSAASLLGLDIGPHDGGHLHHVNGFTNLHLR